jgi:predicted MFS family arabinose efflux permease
VLGSKFKMKWIAGVTFTSRLFIIGMFLLLPKTLINFGIFAALLGLTGSATVPPISGLTEKLFGPARLATLFGLLMVSHQIGSFFSAWLGGICITATGSYTLIWLMSGCFSVLAGFACYMVEEPEPAAQSL